MSEGEERLRKDKHEFSVEREQMRLLKDSLERMKIALNSEKAEVRANIDKKVGKMLESEKKRYELLI